MIKLFKKIRQQLLKGNRFGKYLLYATGEIILVVIGILVALQLNNWNEERKARILEKKTLKELRSDLLQNIKDIEENIVSLETSKLANEIILLHSKNVLSYNESLDFHFANMYPYITFSPIQTTYNNLSQNGINLITNDSIRTHVSELYANQFNLYKVFESTYLVEHYENYLKPMFMTEFVTFDIYESFKPRNYDQFIKNKDYNQIMNYSVENYPRFIIIQSRFKVMAEKLISEIDNEIAK